MSDDFVDKLVKKQLFEEKRKGVAERRSSTSAGASMRGPDRRYKAPEKSLFAKKGSATPMTTERRVGSGSRRAPGRTGGRRISDAPARQVERDLRVGSTASGSSATGAGRGTIVGAPIERPSRLLPKREWQRATDALPRSRGPITGGGKHPSILKRAGRWGKLGAIALGGYAAYKAWKNE